MLCRSFSITSVFQLLLLVSVALRKSRYQVIRSYKSVRNDELLTSLFSFIVTVGTKLTSLIVTFLLFAHRLVFRFPVCNGQCRFQWDMSMLQMTFKRNTKSETFYIDITIVLWQCQVLRRFSPGFKNKICWEVIMVNINESVLSDRPQNAGIDFPCSRRIPIQCATVCSISFTIRGRVQDGWI